jgi:hypothetical protein
MIALDRVKKAPGVYLMLDLDERPVYAGQADNLARRLREHFISQKSDVVTDGLLDIYEVRRVAIWYRIEKFDLPLGTDDDGDKDSVAKRSPLGVMESSLIRHHRPRWNRTRPDYAGEFHPLTIENTDDMIELVPTDELKARREALRRIETKLIHLLRAVRKATISGSSKRVRLAMILHTCDLLAFCKLLIPRGHSSIPRDCGPDYGLERSALP